MPVRFSDYLRRTGKPANQRVWPLVLFVSPFDLPFFVTTGQPGNPPPPMQNGLIRSDLASFMGILRSPLDHMFNYLYINCFGTEFQVISVIKR